MLFSVTGREFDPQGPRGDPFGDRLFRESVAIFYSPNSSKRPLSLAERWYGVSP